MYILIVEHIDITVKSFELMQTIYLEFQTNHSGKT